MTRHGWTRARTLMLASLAVLLTAPAHRLAAQAVRVISLDEAIELALEQDPAAVAAAGTETGALASLRQARAAWLPTATLSSGFNNSSNQRFDQATGQLVSESYSTQLALGYEIFSGGRRLAQHRGARADLRAASAHVRAQHFQTMLETQQTFYAAAAAAELVAVAEQRLQRARQQLTFSQTRLELGTATRSDLLRAELEVGNAELAVVDAESGLRSTRLQLGRQVGVDDEVQPEAGVLPERAPELPALPLLLARAEDASPAAVAARSELQAASADRWSSYTAYLPSVRVTGGYDWFSYEFPANQQSWSLRLTASVPLFNGLSRETNVARARAAERVAEAQARDAAIAARVAAEDATREIAAAERRVEIAQRAVELAREDLRVQEERYQIGNATILDLQTSQVALADAEVGWVRARQALATSVAQLESVLGTSVPDLVLADAPES